MCVFQSLKFVWPQNFPLLCVQFIKDNAHMFLVEGSMVALADQALETNRGGDGDGSSSSPHVSREDANDNCSVQSEGDVSSAGHMVNGFPGSEFLPSFFSFFS